MHVHFWLLHYSIIIIIIIICIHVEKWYFHYISGLKLSHNPKNGLTRISIKRTFSYIRNIISYFLIIDYFNIFMVHLRFVPIIYIWIIRREGIEVLLHGSYNTENIRRRQRRQVKMLFYISNNNKFSFIYSTTNIFLLKYTHEHTCF